MSTLLDEETVVLDALDFDPVCECITISGKCGREATHVLLCVACGVGVGFACMEHAIRVRKTERRATHTGCGFAGAMRELVVVVPL